MKRLHVASMIRPFLSLRLETIDQLGLKSALKDIDQSERATGR